jgi:syntaxin 1B/2/3
VCSFSFNYYYEDIDRATYSNSYPTQASGGGGYQSSDGYQPRRPNPYAQQDDSSYEMSSVSQTPLYNGGGGGGGGGDSGDMSNFFSEVSFGVCEHMNVGSWRRKISAIQDSIRTFNDNISRIGDLHSRSLNNMDDMATQRNAQQLDQLINDTSSLSNQLKRRIKSLEAKGGSGRDGQIRKQQVRPYSSIVIRIVLTAPIDGIGEVQVC